MATEQVQVDWIEDELFLGRDHHGAPLVMGQPMGISAADLLPLSLAGCTVWDVVAILRKQRQVVTGVRVTAESDREDEAPWRFRRIRLCYHITGHSINPDRVQRAIELSEQKYCAVYATLRGAVEIESTFEIIEG